MLALVGFESPSLWGLHRFSPQRAVTQLEDESINYEQQEVFFLDDGFQAVNTDRAITVCLRCGFRRKIAVAECEMWPIRTQDRGRFDNDERRSTLCALTGFLTCPSTCTFTCCWLDQHWISPENSSDISTIIPLAAPETEGKWRVRCVFTLARFDV
jgi:hypothetical protein